VERRTYAPIAPPIVLGPSGPVMSLAVDFDLHNFRNRLWKPAQLVEFALLVSKCVAVALWRKGDYPRSLGALQEATGP
jgi:hypothetical protein